MQALCGSASSGCCHSCLEVQPTCNHRSPRVCDLRAAQHVDISHNFACSAVAGPAHITALLPRGCLLQQEASHAGCYITPPPAHWRHPLRLKSEILMCHWLSTRRLGLFRSRCRIGGSCLQREERARQSKTLKYSTKMHQFGMQTAENSAIRTHAGAAFPWPCPSPASKARVEHSRCKGRTGAALTMQAVYTTLK